MGLFDVIKYDGDANVLAWKHPCQSLRLGTQVVVNEAQEVVLFKGGQACDSFGAGTHTLHTKNIPLLNKIINLPYDGVSPFTAEIWYVNKIHLLNVKWGTPTPIQLFDPQCQLPVNITSYGQFGVKIDDARKFLMKLVGTLESFDTYDVKKHFQGAYISSIKSAISAYLSSKKIGFMDINGCLDELAVYLKEKMSPVFADYGIKIANFYVNDISAVEDEYLREVKEAYAKRSSMNIIGYGYTQERSFDVLDRFAGNQSIGQSGMIGTGLGLGVGLGMSGGIGQQFSNLAQNINTAQMKQCPACGKEIDAKAKFCNFCGADSEAAEAGIKCGKCGAATDKEANFCPKCGNPLKKTCPKCGKTVDADGDFCQNCGEKITDGSNE